MVLHYVQLPICILLITLLIRMFNVKEQTKHCSHEYDPLHSKHEFGYLVKRKWCGVAPTSK